MHDAIKDYRKIIYLVFPPEASIRPVTCDMSRLFNLTFNILKAQISPRQEGYMTLELGGDEADYHKAIEYLREQGVKITPVAQKIFRDEDSCVECGLCTALCPGKALYLDRTTRRVFFDADKCTACGMCTRICPVNAMRVEMDNGW